MRMQGQVDTTLDEHMNGKPRTVMLARFQGPKHASHCKCHADKYAYQLQLAATHGQVVRAFEAPRGRRVQSGCLQEQARRAWQQHVTIVEAPDLQTYCKRKPA